MKLTTELRNNTYCITHSVLVLKTEIMDIRVYFYDLGE